MIDSFSATSLSSLRAAKAFVASSSCVGTKRHDTALAVDGVAATWDAIEFVFHAESVP